MNIAQTMDRIGFDPPTADGILSQDLPLARMLAAETERQNTTLSLVGSMSIAHPSVLAAQGATIGNLTTEGYPGARFHAGCEHADQIEMLAIERAKAVFDAQYANVQPHSGTSANQIAIFSLLDPGDTIMSFALDAGGHLSHGAPVSATGKFFKIVNYGLSEAGVIDYEDVLRIARIHRPKMIIAGASSYPRRLDFARFREVADDVGAYLLADISHIAGLVAAGLHPSPINFAHITTTSTYKQLCGPRGGLLLVGKDHDRPTGRRRPPLAQLLQSAVFPFFQGTPSLGGIAAKARALDFVANPSFVQIAQRILDNAQALAAGLTTRGYKVCTGGTGNHLVLVDLSDRELTGAAAQGALEACGIIVNKNLIAGDKRSPLVTSGIRLGANITALRRMPVEAVDQMVDLVDLCLTAIGGGLEMHRGSVESHEIRMQVGEICSRYPVAFDD